MLGIIFDMLCYVMSKIIYRYTDCADRGSTQKQKAISTHLQVRKKYIKPKLKVP